MIKIAIIGLLYIHYVMVYVFACCFVLFCLSLLVSVLLLPLLLLPVFLPSGRFCSPPPIADEAHLAHIYRKSATIYTLLGLFFRARLSCAFRDLLLFPSLLQLFFV